MADATEEILEKLIDTMHAKMAKGFGSKQVKPVAAIEEALEDAKEDKQENENEETREPSLFENWLQSEKNKKVAPKKNQMMVSKTQITVTPKKLENGKVPKIIVGKK